MLALSFGRVLRSSGIYFGHKLDGKICSLFSPPPPKRIWFSEHIFLWAGGGSLMIALTNKVAPERIAAAAAARATTEGTTG